MDPPVSRSQPKGTVRSRDLSKPIIAVLLVAILVVTACIILYDDDERLASQAATTMCERGF